MDPHPDQKNSIHRWSNGSNQYLSPFAIHWCGFIFNISAYMQLVHIVTIYINISNTCIHVYRHQKWYKSTLKTTFVKKTNCTVHKQNGERVVFSQDPFVARKHLFWLFAKHTCQMKLIQLGKLRIVIICNPCALGDKRNNHSNAHL